MTRSSLIALALTSSLAVGGALAAPTSAGCASHPSAAVVKCVKDTPKVQKKAKKKKKKPRVNLDVDHPVREPDLPKKKKARR